MDFPTPLTRPCEAVNKDTERIIKRAEPINVALDAAFRLALEEFI